MSEVRFYHLTRTRLDQALPALLEKTLQRDWRAVVLTDSDERAEYLAQALWTYREDSFLPHGAKRDGHEAQQPIWITAEDKNANGAQVLFLINGAVSDKQNEYDLICEVFDGMQDSAVEEARKRWRQYKEAGHTISYWKQGDRGWEQV